MMSEYSIADNFNQYFKIKFANTKELRQQAFKIRYGVYSKELGWEPENDRGMETDEYDNSAYHCLLEHRRTGDYAGCIRLIIPPISQPDYLLPFEQNCLESARTNIIDSTQLARGSFGEFSRLAVLESFRRRKKEKNKPYIICEENPDTIYTEEEHRHFPNIAMGLYLAGIALAELCNHVGLFVMVEPKLNRLLVQFGLPFKQVGNEMEYHGKRALFYLDRNDFNSELSQELKELYSIIHNDLAQQISLIPFTNAADK